MIYLLFTVSLSYLFYLQGIRFLFKSKILSNKYAEHIAYIFLMLSGVSVGEFLTLTIFPSFFTLSKWELIILATIISIITGEFTYRRYRKLVKRVVITEKK